MGILPGSLYQFKLTGVGRRSKKYHCIRLTVQAHNRTCSKILLSLYMCFLFHTDHIPVVECQPVDIVFVVDGSGSVGAENFMTVKEWLVNTTTHLFRVFGESMVMAVLEYSHRT